MSVADTIKQKIQESLAPEVLELENTSALHEGHAGHDGSGESHFNLYVVSNKFAGMSRIERQRMLYNLLDEEFKNGLHALSIKAKAPSEVK